MTEATVPDRHSLDTIVVVRADYEALQARVEDLEDRLAVVNGAGGQPMPLEWATRIVNGESPLTVWREFRGLSLRALASAAGLSPGYLSEIETGKKPGSMDAYRALAAVLDTSVDWLLV